MNQDTDLFARYNYDDVFDRTIIIGLLHLLNNELVYEQIWDTNVIENVTVPFMYDFGSSDERFAQDNYTFFGKACFGDRKIDGKFDMLPRGAIKYNGSQIDNGNMTNRFIEARYLKNENGKLVSYIATMTSIPITFNFECEMWIDNIITAFKIEQALRETFYKNRRYDVLYKGTKIPCRCGFPESHTLDKTVSYSFDSERQLKLSFSLSVETYQPVFHKGTELEASKQIEGIAWDVTLKNSSKPVYSINFTNIDNTVVYPSGSNMLIEWESKSNVSSMCTICLAWIDEDGKHHLIDSPRLNTKSYVWHIPDDISGYTAPNIIFDDYTKIIKEPVIKVIPSSDGRILEDSFIILDAGRFVQNETMTSYNIPLSLDYLDESNNVVVSTSYSALIINNQLNNIVLTGTPIKYKTPVTPKKISLQITYPLEPQINDKIDNLLII